VALGLGRKGISAPPLALAAAAPAKRAEIGELMAANRGLSGNACRTGGSGRPFHQDGCGGMDERELLC
jgi:hypothetical protein